MHVYGNKAWALEHLVPGSVYHENWRWFRLMKGATLEEVIEFTMQMKGPKLTPDRFRLVNIATEEVIPVALFAV